MGHERVGELPKTKRWRDIVQAVGSLGQQQARIPEIARRTTEGIRSQFRSLQRDPSLLAAFKFLVTLAVASRGSAPQQTLSEWGIDIPGEPTPLSLVKALRVWVTSRAAPSCRSRLAS